MPTAPSAAVAGAGGGELDFNMAAIDLTDMKVRDELGQKTCKSQRAFRRRDGYRGVLDSCYVSNLFGWGRLFMSDARRTAPMPFS